MAQVLSRNVDDAAITRPRARAARKGTSLERELRATIVDARDDRHSARTRAAALRRSLVGRRHSDSTVLIRTDRRR
jgi:plasmid stability protein